jgi:hypothetical protein
MSVDLPGATAFIRRLGHSLAHDRVMPSTACFEVQYADSPAIPRNEAPLAILTILPAPTVLWVSGSSPSAFLACCLVIFMMASVPMFHDPVTLIAMMRPKSSSVAIFPSVGQMPAQFTKPSKLPEIESINFLQLSRCVISQSS